MPEAKIAKIFYVSILAVCLVRGTCFALSTIVLLERFENKDTTSAQVISTTAILLPEESTFQATLEEDQTQIPNSIVMLLIAPDFFVNYAYLNLVWQLYSFYFDGFASLQNFVCYGKGETNVIIISLFLFFS